MQGAEWVNSSDEMHWIMLDYAVRVELFAKTVLRLNIRIVLAQFVLDYPAPRICFLQ